MEQCFVGSVCKRLEQTSAQLFASTRLPLFNLSLPPVQRIGDIRHVPVVGIGARVGHGMSLQEGARVLVHDATAADASGDAQSNQASQRPKLVRECGVLDWAFRWPECADQLLSFDLVL